jgi:hypothetical protein
MARMHSVRSRTRSNAVLAMLLALLVLACGASSVRAEAWGELGSSLSLKAGTGKGEIEERNGLVRFAAGLDGSYYLLTEKLASGELVLQRFEKGSAKVQAEATLKGEKGAQGGTEGVNAMLTVDPTDPDRVYVLSVYERKGPTNKEEEHEEYPVDSEMLAAGTLYVFEYSKEKLKSAASLGRLELKGAGEKAKEALLDPRGIAVDPEDGDLVISGNQDETEVRSGTAQKQCRPAVQFVAVKAGSGGVESMSPGARYVDKNGALLLGHTGCGEAEEEEGGIEQAPASPVFAPDGSLLGYGEDEEIEPEGIIWKLTPNGADKQPAGEVAMTPEKLFVTESIPTFEPATGGEEPASVMSLVPETGSKTEGTIYVSGYYNVNQQPAPLVLHYKSGGEPSISEVGWTAGGSTNENAGPGPCDLHKAAREPIMLGGLSGSSHSFLALTFYKEFEGPKHEVEKKRAEVVKFGEGGSTVGCPGGKEGAEVPLTKPTQSLHGEPASEVPAGTPLEITSVLGAIEPDGSVSPAAGAKSVTWTVKHEGKVEEFGPTTYEFNGLHEVEPLYGIQLELSHTFSQTGTYEISDTAHTDDLADEIVHSPVDVLTVTGGKLTVKPKAPEPTEVRAHEQEATVKAIVEVPGQGTVAIKKLVWSFGDNGKQESGKQQLSSPATLEVKHTFSRCGSAKITTCKIKLTVETENGEKVAEQLVGEIKVRESKAEEEAESPGSPPEEHTTTTSTTSTPTSTPPPPPSSPQPKGGVQAYIASFSGSSLVVSTSGLAAVKISCPSGGSCSGVLTLQTASAVAASGKKKVLTLASGSFSLAGGGKTISLHLSSQAKALLSRSHGVLKAKLTILSRAAGGHSNTTTHVVTLHLAKKKH